MKVKIRQLLTGNEYILANNVDALSVQDYCAIVVSEGVYMWPDGTYYEVADGSFHVNQTSGAITYIIDVE